MSHESSRAHAGIIEKIALCVCLAITGSSCRGGVKGIECIPRGNIYRGPDGKVYIKNRPVRGKTGEATHLEHEKTHQAPLPPGTRCGEGEFSVGRGLGDNHSISPKQAQGVEQGKVSLYDFQIKLE